MIFICFLRSEGSEKTKGIGMPLIIPSPFILGCLLPLQCILQAVVLGSKSSKILKDMGLIKVMSLC